MTVKEIIPVLVFGCLLACGGPALTQLEFGGNTMGTTYSVKVVVPEGSDLSTDELQPEIDTILRGINSEMSTYDPDSVISRFNRHFSEDPFPVPTRVLFVVDRSLFWSARTGGAFDITVFPLLDLWGFGPDDSQPPQMTEIPGEEAIRGALETVGYTRLQIRGDRLLKSRPNLKIDLGGIAKGFGVDVVFEYLEGRGFRDFLVEIGGEVRARGRNRLGSAWRVAVARPVPSHEVQANPAWILTLDDRAVATSGDYQSYFELDGRTYSHEIDPRTGHPASTGVASATVTAVNCTDADALATVLMVLTPEQGLHLIESLEDTEAFWVIREDQGVRIQQTEGVPLHPGS